MKVTLTRRDDGERIALPGLGMQLRVLVPAAATGGQICLIEELTPSGYGPPLHIHHQRTEVLRFLEGHYEVEVDGERFAVGAGDVVVVLPGRRHAFRNVGATVARLSCTMAPAGTGELFYREMAALLADGEADLATLNALAVRHDTEFVGPPLGAGPQAEIAF